MRVDILPIDSLNTKDPTMTNTSPNLADSVNKEKLMTDVKTVLSDAEALLKQAASSSGEKAAELRERGMGLLRQAKEKAQDLQDAVVTKSKAAARATDDYVHDHPWQAVGVAAGVGLLIGLLLNRK
ncbi:hypothetical protein R82526_01004 [Ralstonia mannitolilytica]|jgi:ElaB/YqjD/DUF883 family membrane-anchored ribosome-binding protein|uniref:DUF883 domain-containing protein n=2 Tax=Ralstonia TaxID=48736 RepID=A0AAD2ASV4_9RALS|nr:hypothetical protein R82526_01004 [Ralstonia mannitolilytica]CAJ0684532.1 hypothetical protein R77591_02524 [Ralstonia mannitolilytica]CAJ0690196.1 hypothetical protein LMG18102_01238 [Ralstonia mannitolilytica]CAJ0709489.1 hypothetical protein LMG8323_00646 [Ralstonia mannitolilytica]CAJ0742489.1 hypothetical protein R76696_04007 [Ralstonia mannitolilytica]